MRSASGARRTATSPIDASGVLLDGTKVDGPAALRGALLQQKDQFVKAVTGKLLMYALGREIDYHDAPAIRAIVRAAAADDYRWSSTILAIVKSTPFQIRRSQDHDRHQEGHFPAHRASRHRRRPCRLPLLDAMIPALTASQNTPAKAVRRLAVVYHPNGVVYENWLPKGVGRRVRVLARARRRSRRSAIAWSSSRGSPIARPKRSATAAATIHARPART